MLSKCGTVRIVRNKCNKSKFGKSVQTQLRSIYYSEQHVSTNLAVPVLVYIRSHTSVPVLVYIRSHTSVPVLVYIRSHTSVPVLVYIRSHTSVPVLVYIRSHTQCLYWFTLEVTH